MTDTRPGSISNVARALPFVVAGAIVLSWLLLVRVWREPFWISMGCAAVCFAALVGSRRRGTRILWFNVGAIILLFGISEALFRPDAEELREVQTDDGFWVQDADLGYRLGENGRAHHARYYRGQPIYDVIYHSGPDGLRVGLDGKGSTPSDCLLFFGGSFVFGEGVDDDETLPNQVAKRVGDRYSVYNFGVGGYGPHHMLAQIQNGTVERVARCNAKHAFYVLIQDHISRAVGVGDGLPGGPRFVLKPRGGLVRDGNYPARPAEDLVRDWSLGRTLLDARRRHPPEDDVALFLAIVAASRAALEERYPGIEFHAVVWGRSSFEELGITAAVLGGTVFWVYDILPPHLDSPSAYHFPHDGHPTPLANRLIAEYLVTTVLSDESVDG